MRDPGKQIISLVNAWRPSKSSKLKVTTTLVPPTERWPIRVHKLEFKADVTHSVFAVEGGFAIYGEKRKDGGLLTLLGWNSQAPPMGESAPDEGVLENGPSSLFLAKAGASGIRHILRPNTMQANGVVLKPDSNTNLMVWRTLIPTIQ
jgi:hypothetical protein